MSPDLMDILRVSSSRITSLFRRRKLDAELDEELSAHLDLAIEEHTKGGMTYDDARIAALRAFGGVTQSRETYRSQRGFPLMQQVACDLRFAFRQLRRSPGFAFTVVVTLALGIGAVTSVFSVVDAVLLKPFAFRDPGQLVVVRDVVEEMRSQDGSEPMNYRHYQRLKQASKTLEDAAIFQMPGLSVSPTGEHPRIVGGIRTSANLFRMLGVQPILGRDFAESDTEKGAEPVVMLSHEAWKTFFAGDRSAIGKTMRVGGEPAIVIGVLPPGIRLPHFAMAPNIAFQETPATRETMIYQPFAASEWDLKTDVGNFNYRVIARLKPSVTLAQASAELGTLQRSYSDAAHLPIHLGISLTPLAKDVTSGIRGALWLMFTAVFGVLLIACVNLANLQLARSVAQERETAVRGALGASKVQVMMGRLIESLLLATIGAALGVALAFTGVKLFIAVFPDNIPRLDEATVNVPVLLFAAALSTVSALLFGILPALHSLRIEPQRALQAHTARAAGTYDGQRTRSLLVGAQIACTVCLLIITSLVLRSFSQLMRQDRGFSTDHVTLAQVDLFAPQYDDAHGNVSAVKLAFADRALAGLKQIPGVQAVAITSATPLAGETWVDYLSRPDHSLAEGKRPLANLRWVNESYLSTMQIPLIAGRNFTASDRTNPNVALISERTAREAFPGEDPLGKKLSDIVPDSQKEVTIVGVVADTRINGLKDTAAMVYIPYWAYTPWTLSFLVRSSEPADAVMPEVRRVLWQIDPQVAIPTLKPMDEQVGDSVAIDRFQAIVLSCFGVAALMLALLGVYGVLAYSVSLRRHEFGIRIALGSSKPALIALVMRWAAPPVVLGTSIGLGMGILALRWVRSMLYQMPFLDPMAISGSVMLLLIAAAIAAIIPARRAASVDPMRALRIE